MDAPNYRDIQSVNTRVDKLEARFEALDTHGSRGVGVLQLQVGELIKDLVRIETTVKEQIKGIKTGKWQTVGAFIAAILPIYILLINLILTK